MNADLSWGEVRWREHHSSPPSNGSIMATSTLPHAARPLTTDDRQDNMALASQHNFQIDRRIEAAPQSQLHYPAAHRMSNTSRSHSDAHNTLDSTSNLSRGTHVSGTASPQSKLETLRPASISEGTDWQINSSRRPSKHPHGLEPLGTTGMYFGILTKQW